MQSTSSDFTDHTTMADRSVASNVPAKLGRNHILLGDVAITMLCSKRVAVESGHACPLPTYVNAATVGDIVEAEVTALLVQH